jgi:DNA-binding MarR family transcriptional regulator
VVAFGEAADRLEVVANLLARDGPVTYEKNPARRRAQLVRLTPRGRSALSRIRPAQREWANTLGDRIGEKDLRTANRILAGVLEALHGLR